MDDSELERLPELGCHQLRDSLGYEHDDRAVVFACGNCGWELEKCPRCGGQVKRKIALAQKGDK